MTRTFITLESSSSGSTVDAMSGTLYVALPVTKTWPWPSCCRACVPIVAAITPVVAASVSRPAITHRTETCGGQRPSSHRVGRGGRQACMEAPLPLHLHDAR